MPYCPSPMFWMAIFSVLESSQPWVSAWPSQKPSVLFLLCHMAITSIHLNTVLPGGINQKGANIPCLFENQRMLHKHIF